MTPIAYRVELPALGSPGGALSTAAWVFAPAPRTARPDHGGVRVRRRRLLEGVLPHGHPGHRDYSMATHLASRGFIVVACDQLATGESSRPQPADTLRWETVVEANQLTVEGTRDAAAIRRRTYDALVLLGRAIGATDVPAPPDAAHPGGTWRALALQHDEVASVSQLVEGFPRQTRRTAWQRYLVYWDDVPEAVIRFDERLATTMPLASRGSWPARRAERARGSQP